MFSSTSFDVAAAAAVPAIAVLAAPAGGPRVRALLETMFAPATDGKTNPKGMPNPLRLAVIARAHFDTVRLPFPPTSLQRLGLALAAPLGRLLGYRATYERDLSPQVVGT